MYSRMPLDQPPLSHIDITARNNPYLYSDHFQIELGTYSYPTNTGHIPPPLPSSYCFLHTLYYLQSFSPLPLPDTPP